MKRPSYDETLNSMSVHALREALRGMSGVASGPVFKAMGDGLKDYQVADAIAEAVRHRVFRIAKVFASQSTQDQKPRVPCIAKRAEYCGYAKCEDHPKKAQQVCGDRCPDCGGDLGHGSLCPRFEAEETHEDNYGKITDAGFEPTLTASKDKKA